MKNSFLTRRSFILTTALGAIAVSSQLLLTACGSSSTSPSGTGSQATNGGDCEANGTGLETTGSTDGHTHTFQLSAGQLASAASSGGTFSVSNIGHTHSVTLSAAQIATLQANQVVSITTGTDSLGGDLHTHTLSIGCS